MKFTRLYCQNVGLAFAQGKKKAFVSTTRIKEQERQSVKIHFKFKLFLKQIKFE